MRWRIDFSARETNSRGTQPGGAKQLLYHRPMMLKTVSGGAVELADSVILAAAGRIYASRRKTCAGPTRVFCCRWCNAEIRGRIPLEAHERDCTQRPSGDLVGVTDADLIALAWTPDLAL